MSEAFERLPKIVDDDAPRLARRELLDVLRVGDDLVLDATFLQRISESSLSFFGLGLGGQVAKKPNPACSLG